LNVFAAVALNASPSTSSAWTANRAVPRRTARPAVLMNAASPSTASSEAASSFPPVSTVS
jgi:hypothetical protein